ncbi:MAG: aldehyde ferredoxin oxidoreductase family protein [Candidatus Bathyarchaeota archaeon]
MYGWFGKGLKINLSSKAVKEFKIEQDVLLNFVGGRGLAAKIFYENVNPRVDAFSDENILIFAVGPLTATSIPTTGRFTLASKSPLTGGFFYSSCGGVFGASFKKSGYDVLVVEGKAKNPVYIQIDNGDVKVRDASNLWSKTTKETFEQLKKDLGKDFSIACIGPAGENLVRYACVFGGLGSFAGRGGLGAVMGSKNLKAVAVRGDKKVKVANEDEILNLMDVFKVRVTWNPVLSKALATFGTPVLLDIMNEHEILPTKNFQHGRFDKAEKISAEALGKIVVGKRGCYACSIACKRITKAKWMIGDGPEFETLGSLGSMLMIDGVEAVAELNYLCNDLGMDTISTGGVIACAMELSERGMIDEKVSWGDVEKVRSLIYDIAYRRNLGLELAEGSKIFAKKYNGEIYAMHVKGLELPMYNPQGVLGQALAYVTSNRGGCHLNAYLISVEVLGYPYLMNRFSTVGKSSVVVYLQNLSATIDSMIICKFLGFEFDEKDFAEYLRLATGERFTQESVITIGERIWNLERVLNLKAGISGDEDKLPARFNLNIDSILKEYYMIRGWDSNGVPLKVKLESLGLADCYA